MTREEAIKTLRELWRETNDSWYEEAYKVAIEALSEETSTINEKHQLSDLISREEVLRAIITAGEVEPDLGYTHLHDVIKSLPSADAVDVYKAHEEEHLNIVNRIKELQYAIAKTQTIVGKMVESAEAEQIHNDGTLEVKVPNAQKVGRVLVMDTDSHIGGGLFYPDDAERSGEWIEAQIDTAEFPINFLECTECGYRIGRETYLENTFNYCPNCGARMENKE